MPRFHCPLPLAPGHSLVLPEGAARHVQVLRMQPGMPLTLFNGEGGEFMAEVVHMGKREVQVRVLSHEARECEAERQVHLALGMPANDRMDWLVEKATELGVARITPLHTERSVLRLNGERAHKKWSHWQDIAASACEQCGRNRLPHIDKPQSLREFLAQPLRAQAQPWVLSLHAGAQALAQQALASSCVVLSGPEGGLSDAEDAAARAVGYRPVHLGSRTLRAETAALAALSVLTLT
jgi:16S rRNA (uracil1498-N3)-methyltransferase